MKKLTILVMVVGLIALLYGCCSHSGDAVFVKPQGDTVVTSREVIIDELGRLPTVTFPSGAKIEGLEENTLTPGLIVTIVEQKTTTQNTALFNNSENIGLYLYKITAFMNLTNSVGAKTYVTTTEKPIKITLPKQQDSDGIILAGIKESDTDPWRLFNFSDSDEVIANIAGVRAAGKNINDNTFCLFMLGIQFALVSYGGSKGEKLPESYVTGLTATSTASILVKDGKYFEDLTIKGLLKGVSLDSIKPTDLRVRITYRNSKVDNAPLKVNGAEIPQTPKIDKTVPGYSYQHYFVVDSISDSSMMGTSGEFSFTLNLSGIETKSFPSGFLIEFFDKVSSEKVLPCYYAKFYSISPKEVVNVTVKTTGANDEGFYELNPTFTLGIGKTLNDSDRKKIESAISVSDVEPDNITKAWEGENITIGFTDELEQDTTYIISVSDITDIEGVSITDVEDITFTTKRVNNSFAISYNLDGGILAAGESNPTTYDTGSATFSLFNPTKESYTFVGWSGTEIEGIASDVTIIQGSTGNREYTANWSEVAYIITYNLDGGIATPANPTGYNIASETFVLNEPTKAGYTFIGWTGSNGDVPQKPVSVVQGSKSDLSFTANYALIAYNIEYVLNDGSLPQGVTNPTSYDITSATITLHNPIKEGYTFSGWTNNDLNIASMTLSIPQGSMGDRTYTAKWSAVAYRITYELSGGVLAETNPDGYNFASETFTLNEPTKEGYTFIGWTGSNGDVPQKPVSVVQGSTDNREYTANWSINSYRLDLVAGTGIATVIGANTYEYGTEVTASCTMLAGYQFDKWTGDITTETFNMPAYNATMTANAKPIVYNIAYNLDGGEQTGDNPVNYDITSATISLNNPTKTGYTFTGWSGTNLTGNENMTVTIEQGSTGDRSYTAHFTPISYTIAYTMNDGTVATPNPTSYDITSATININNPTKDYYDFIGWSGTDLTGNTNTSVSIAQGSTGNRSYTANFTPTSYTITYNLDGGTNDAANPATYDITSATITLNKPTKTGYAFIGWSGTGLIVASSTLSIPQGSTGDREYTANWIEGIIFDLGNSVELVMHKIPAGNFERYENGNKQSGTKQTITISESFYIGRFEVTQDQYFAVIASNPSSFKEGAATNVRPTISANYPVEEVSWNDIAKGPNCFLNKINTQLEGQIPSGYKFDLPTEAQWEYACRAGTTTDFNNSTNRTGSITETYPDTNLDGLAWYASNSTSKTHEVGKKSPNAWGLYDMHGNVCEWCKDWYGSYATGNLSDPTGPTSSEIGYYRIVRGGSWDVSPYICCSWCRAIGTPNDGINSHGFRLALVKVPTP